MPLTRKRFLSLSSRAALGAAAYSTLGFLDRNAAGKSTGNKPCEGMRLSDARFLYRGSAVGVGGRITDPPLGEIPAQAATTLPIDGGNSDVRVEGYTFHGIVYVGSAHSTTKGNPDLKTDPDDRTKCQQTFRTVATSTVNGLDVDGVVRADTLVASLESEQPTTGGQLRMLPVGYFTNLRVRGYAINPRPHQDLLETASLAEVASRCLRSGHLYDPNEPANQYDPLDPVVAANVPAATAIRYSGETVPELIACSIFDDRALAEEVSKIPPGAGVRWLPGGRIRVRDFGDIYLGEYLLTADARRLTLLRVEMASPPTGSVSLASVEGDGRPR